MDIRKWLYNPRGYAGRAWFGEFISWSHGGYSLPQRELTLRVGAFYFSVVIGGVVWFDHLKTLANGDRVPASEVIAPDDWRNQPTRPDGSSWDERRGTISS